MVKSAQIIRPSANGQSDAVALPLVTVVFLSLALSMTANAQNVVHVVDQANGPGTHFLEVQPAVDAASNRDIILVRPGTYGPVTVTDKTLSLVGIADGAGVLPELDSVLVRDLQSSRHFVLRGFSIEHDQGITAAAFYSFNNLGSVLVEDVDATEAFGLFGGNAGALVIDSPSVSFARCFFQGLNATQALGPFENPFASGPGIQALRSNVSAYDSTFHGGLGANATVSLFGVAQAGLAGGHGARIQESTFFAAGSVFLGRDGGNGGASTQVGCLDPADGGHGLTAIDSSFFRSDNQFTSGTAGAPAGGCPSSASNGLALDLTTTSETIWNEQLRTFEVTSPAVEGQLTTTTFGGMPGENVVMLVALAPENTLIPSVRGLLLGAAPLSVVILGAVPASGTLQFSLTIPVGTLPPSIDGLEVYEQCFVGGSTGFGLTSAPSSLVIVR